MKAFFAKIWAWIVAHKLISGLIAGGVAVVLAVSIAVPCGVSAAKKRKAQEESSINDGSGSQSDDQGDSGQQGGGDSGGQTHTHTWSATWTSNETQHWHACSGCTETKDKADHTFGEWSVASPEKEERTCSVCGYKEEKAHVHTFGEWQIVSETKEERECSACGYKDERAHTHTFSNEWSHNGVNHWHTSSCGHTATSGTEAHQYDEMGVCEICDYFKGLEVSVDTSIDFLEVVADEVYIFRFEQVVGAHYQLQTNYDLMDADTYIKGQTSPGTYVDVPLDFDHGAVQTADGYYYFKFIPAIGASDVYFKFVTCDYVHGFIGDTYVGETLIVDDTFHANVQAGLRYFRKVSVVAGDKYYYRMENESTEVIGDYSFYTYQIVDGKKVFSVLQPDENDFVTATQSTEIIVAVDVTEDCISTGEYFEKDHGSLNAYGFCVNCHEYGGTDIMMHEDIDYINLDYDSEHPENTEVLYFRLHLETPVAIERIYYGEMQSSDIKVYRKTGAGIEDLAEVTNLSRLEYNVPAASSDGYYYVVIKPVGSDIEDGGFWFEDRHTDRSNFTDQGFCIHNGAYYGIDVNFVNTEYYFDTSDRFEDCDFAFFRFRPGEDKNYILTLKNQLSHDLVELHTYCKDGEGFASIQNIDYIDPTYKATGTAHNYYDIIDAYDNDGYVYVWWEGGGHTGEEFVNTDYFTLTESDAV